MPNKLYRLLSALSAEELYRLDERLEHKAPDSLERKLFLRVRQYLIEPAAKWPSNDQLTKWLPRGWGRLPMTEVRHIMARLCKHIEDMFVQIAFERKKSLQQELLLEELSNRGLDKSFAQHHRKWHRIDQSSSARDASAYSANFRVEQIQYRHKTRGGDRSTEQDLLELNQALDLAYLANKLKYACEMLNRQAVLAGDAQLSALDAILAGIDATTLESAPAVAVYWHILNTLRPGAQVQHYKAVQALLKTQAATFESDELRDIYVFVLNFCIRQINQGNQEFLSELFATYQVLLKRKLLIENGKLAQFHFKNIVTTGLRQREFEWVEAFIEHYKMHLNAAMRNNAVRYNLASLHFARKEYSQARKQLLAVKFTDVFYHLDANTLLIKSYYELDEIESLLSAVNALQTYLRRSRKISDVQRKTYLNQLKFVKKLTRVKLGSKKPVSEIATELESTQPIADAQWLREKVEELL